MAQVKPDEIILKHDGEIMTATFRYGRTEFVTKGPLSGFYKTETTDEQGAVIVAWQMEGFELVEVRFALQCGGDAG